MIIHNDHESIMKSVDGAKAGLQYTSLELTARDFEQLAKLPPAELREWVMKWSLGFRPVPS